ncbi:hypothetical protein ABZT06_40490, partial [Streptomyces sp. NPDC005483]
VRHPARNEILAQAEPRPGSVNTRCPVRGGNFTRVNLPRLHWALSRVKVEPVTEAAAKAAAQLLKGAGLHGHKYAIDATVAEAALRQPGPVAVLTSDVDDMTRLCGSKVLVIGL